MQLQLLERFQESLWSNASGSDNYVRTSGLINLQCWKYNGGGQHPPGSGPEACLSRTTYTVLADVSIMLMFLSFTWTINPTN